MSAPHDVGRHPTAADFDRAELGSLPEERRRELAAHVRECSRCAETQAALQRATARFRDEVFPRSLPRIVPRALAATNRPAARLRRWWSEARAGVRWASVAAPVAAALVLTAGSFAYKTRGTSTVDQEPAVATKGGPALHLFVRRGDRVFAAQPGSVLAPGDAVRFVAEPAGHHYLLVVSIDGAGKVSVYHPFDGAESAPLAPAGRAEVPGSIVLDCAPGPERIVAVFSDAPLSAAAVGQQLRQLAAAAGQGSGNESGSGSAIKLALPDTEQVSLVFEKKGELQQ